MSLLDKEKIILEIFLGDFAGNKTEFARKLGVSRSQMYIFLDMDTEKTSNKILHAIYKYCLETNRNPKDFIFPDGIKATNTLVQGTDVSH